VSKPEFPAAKLPKDNSQMRSFWYGGINAFALKGRERLFYRTFSAGIGTRTSRRFTSGYGRSAASPPGMRVLTQTLKPEVTVRKIRL